MATNKNTEVRKLQRTGEDGGSYTLTLPRDLVEELKWRKGQKLTVTREGKRLIVQDWK